MGKPFGLRLVVFAVRAFTGEVRKLRQVTEQLVDTTRLINGLPLLYAEKQVEPPDRAPQPAGWMPRAGESVSWWLLEELAAQYKLAADLEPEHLCQIAVDRGWVDPKTGHFLVLPDTAGMQLDEQTMRSVVGAN